MNSMRSLVAVVALALAFAVIPSRVQAQTDGDPNIEGSYRALLNGEIFVIPPGAVSNALFVVNLNGGLLNFELEYSDLGFHDGRITSALLFLDGRRVQVTGDIFVLPLEAVGVSTNIIAVGEPNPDNRDAIFNIGPVALEIAASLSGEMSFEGILRYVDRRPGQLLDSAITYEGEEDVITQVSYQTAVATPSGVVIITVIFNFEGTPRIEAEKLSQTPLFFGFESGRVYR